MRSFCRAATVAAIAMAAQTALAQATTVATFRDPAANASTPVFSLVGNSFTGGWADEGLNLAAPLANTIYNNVTMVMTPLTWDGIVGLSGGSIQFLDGDSLVFQIDFASASLVQPFVFGASEFVANNVVFSGPATDGKALNSEQFAFSFANPVITPGSATYTAAFTSSAVVVPEPASMGLLALGGMVALLRRRLA